MAISQFLIEITITSQFLGEIMAIMRFMVLVLVEIVWSILRNQENYLR